MSFQACGVAVALMGAVLGGCQASGDSNGRPASAAVAVEVVQRTRAAVADTGLFLEIGDITGGQVVVEVRDARGAVWIPRQSMRVGDIAAFEDGSCAVGMASMVNNLIGTDRASFLFGPTAVVARGQIDAMLERMRGSEDAVFVCGDRRWTGADLALELEDRAATQGPFQSGAEFVRASITQAAPTDQRYEIERRGRRVPLDEWLMGRSF